MTSLTDAYVAQVVRRLPEGVRSDIAEEITTTLSDMVAARVGAPDAASPDEIAAAERAAIGELGDPVLLARRYSDAPQYLIGPDLYPAFTRLITWLLPLVGVVAALVNAVTYVATRPDPAIGGVIGAVAGGTVMALLVAFAAAVVLMVVAERTLPEKDRARLARSGASEWSVEHLEGAEPARRIPRAEPIASLITLALLAFVPFLPTTFFYVGHLNDGGTFVNPELRSSWIPAYLVALAVLGLIEVWRLVRGTWSTALLAACVVADVAFAVFLTVAVLTQQVLDPALFDNAVGEQLGWMPAAVVVLIWVVVIWDQIVTLKAARRS